MKVGQLLRLLVLFWGISLPFSSQAGEVIHSKTLKGNGIKPNAVIDLSEDRFSEPLFVGNVENHLILRYTGSERTFYTVEDTFSISVSAQVKLYAAGAALPFDVDTVLLTINYDQTAATNYSDKMVWKSEGGHRMVVKVLSVSCEGAVTSYGQLTNDFILESEVHVARYDFFSLAAGTLNPSHSIDTTNYTALIVWDFVPGAEEFELEWFYINHYSGPVVLDFWEGIDGFGNATRVVVSNNWYELNLPFEHGYIFYRVRPVGKLTETMLSQSTKHVPAPDYGAWSMGIPEINLDSIYNNENTRNWRYDATYAEEGKRKEVLTVFDGSGRQRQTITINNTENDAVVMENFYDVEGRLTVQTLPAPSNNPALKFYENYNLNANGLSSFSKNDFDLVDGSITSVYNQSELMNPSSGPSKYYSSSNVLASTGYHAFVPNADSLPYTRTVYGRDGRVFMQSGPGATHAIGSGHEVVMTYAGPLQQKLDRLFGNEIGYADYFRVVMTEDANGQRSLSYQKLDGTVVATSLIGFPDAEGGEYLLDLLDQNIADTITASFRGDNQLNPLEHELTINKSFLVEDTISPYHFNYTLDSTAYREMCTDSLFSCAYILRIELYDQQDQRIYDTPEGESPYVAWADTPKPSVLFVEYPITEAQLPFSLEFDVHFPAVGKYRIVKRLMPDMDHAQSEFERYLAMIDNPTHPSYGNCKLEWVIDPPDFSSCITNCDTLCAYYALAAGHTYSTNPSSSYQLFLDSCSLASGCSNSPWEDVADCDILRDAILRDMGPGGQYFESENLSGLASHPGEWFEDNVAEDGGAEWTAFNFRNPQDSVIRNYADLKYYWYPSFLTQPFEDPVSGKDSLIQFHPEYCALEFCYVIQESKFFDLSLSQVVTTYAAAVDSGYINCDTSTIGTALIAADPYFDTITVGLSYFSSTFEDVMLDIMNDADPVGTTNLWNAAIFAVEAELSVSGPCNVTFNCAATPWTVTFSNCATTDTSVTIDEEYIQNLIWQRFVVQYLKIKKAFYKFHRNKIGCPYLYDVFPTDTLLPGDYYADLPSSPTTRDEAAEGYVIRDPDVTRPFEDLEPQLNDDGTWTVTLTDSADVADFLNTLTKGTANQYTPCHDSLASIRLPLVPFYCDSVLLGYRLWVSAPADFQFGGEHRCLVVATGGVGTIASVVFTHEAGEAAGICPSYTGAASDGFVFSAVQLDTLIQFLTIAGFEATITGNSLVIVEPQGPGTFEGLELRMTNCGGYVPGDAVVNATLGTFQPPCDTTEPSIPNCLCQQMETLYTAYYDSVGTECAGCSRAEFVAWVFNNQFFHGPDSVWASPIDTVQVLAWMANCASNAATCYEFPLELDAACNPKPVQAVPVPRELQCWAPDDCADRIMDEWNWWNDQLRYQAELARRNEFLDKYLTACMAGAKAKEDLTVTFEEREYHFTLYYYDAAGNLVRTVPPAGVQPIRDSATLQSVHLHRKNPGFTPAVYPLHSPSHPTPQDELVTFYEYNTFGQVQKQKTPDGGTTEFWYDVLGRVKYSQNEKQAGYAGNTYSTTVYDNLGRVTEVFEAGLDGPLGNVYSDSLAYKYVNGISGSGIGLLTIADWTVTTYDEGSDHAAVFGTADGHNLRNRVAEVKRYTGTVMTGPLVVPAPVLTSTTYYSYDPHGNVRELVQEHREGMFGNAMATFLMRKRMEYGYDLISGNVNSMAYQNGEADMLVHRYYYDADNRLTNVYTSTDGVIWDNDAKYFYYKHGPLARMEIGDKKLQGVDYAYTVHGWLKGVNSNMLSPQYDMGKDGLDSNLYLGSGTEGLHHAFANDAFGFTLGYYHNPSQGFYDYQMIGGGTPFEAALSSGGTLSPYRAGTHNLYNGNIGHMVTGIPDPDSLLGFATVGYAYRYDQLNRLKGMTAYTDLTSNSWMSSSGTTAWNTSYSYDPNGNLLALTRNDASGTLMDNLSYRYDTVSGRLLNNRLLSVDDPVNGGVGDIYDLHEYQYDEVGNLVKDESEGIDSIIWDAYGKVWKILRTDTSSRPELEFRYDAMGNRIMKIAKHGENQEDWAYSIYSRDATGNVIAVYERKWASTMALTSPDADLVLQIPTHPGLGTGLIGVKVNGIYLTNGPVLTEKTAALTATALANAVNAYETEQFDFTAEVDGDIIFLFTEEEYEQPLHFEVLDAEPSLIDGDYFDFLDVTVRGFKPHSGTFIQVPLIETVSLQELHLYGNSRLGIKTPYLELDKRQVKSAYANNYGDSIYLSMLDSRNISLVNPFDGPKHYHEKGLKQYELSNHLGNILVVFEDKKIAFEGLSGEIGYYKPAPLSIHDFYPGGMPLHLRTINVEDYRYGHNTQESDPEITGNWGSHYTAEFWMYDSRVQRRWEIDPIVKPHESSYATFANNYIQVVDIGGDDTINVHLNSGGSGAAEAFLSTVKNPNQGDMYTVYGDLTVYVNSSRSLSTYYKEIITKVYHAGNDYAAAGWYSQEEYELINLDWAGGQVMPPRNVGWDILNGERSFFFEGINWQVDSDGYLTGWPTPIAGMAPDVGLRGGVKGLYNAVNLSTKALNAGNIQKHHVLIQHLKGWFKSRGIANIDDYCIVLDKTVHLNIIHGKGAGFVPGYWNKEWLMFVKNNPNATPSEIFHFAEGLLKRYKLDHLPYVPYR